MFHLKKRRSRDGIKAASVAQGKGVDLLDLFIYL